MSQHYSLPCKPRHTASFCVRPAGIARGFLLLLIILSLIGRSTVNVEAASVITFTGEELVGKPTDNSITINIVPNSTIEYKYEYGTSPGVYTGQTSLETADGGQPHEIAIMGLNPNTRYYYRMLYHAPGDAMDDWVVRDEYSFWTQRAPGSTFVFTVISDSHAMYNSQYQQAMQHVSNDHPDFHVDLGDTFMTDGMGNQNSVNNAYLAQRDPLYMDRIGHSAPIFLASGNHENEEGWNLDDAFSLALASVKARKLYYPTPIQDGFYTGNTDILPALINDGFADGYREDYYAWEWGDVLFVVIDPYQYTMTNPYGSMAGEGSDDPATGDRWNWTLGQQQFEWFRQTIEESNAKYKFVFAHHMLGGTQNYVRGGAVPAHMFEWGGYNADGTTWGFETKRPGWGDDPIHQLMVDNHVSAFFHGHDHQYAYELRDGIVYQSLPRPSTGLDFNYYSESNEYTIKVLPSPGYLRVTVTPAQTTVDYIGSSSGTSSYAYAIYPATVAATYDLTVAVDPSGGGVTNPAEGVHPYDENTTVDVTAMPNLGYVFDHWSGACTGADACQIAMDDEKMVTAHFVRVLGDVNLDGAVTSTDALIVLTCDAGLDTAQFCPMNCGDVNADGRANSTDALIILSFDVGMSVGFPLGQPGCPASVEPGPGCTPDP